MEAVIKKSYFKDNTLQNLRRTFISYIFNKYVHLELDCAEFGVSTGFTANCILDKLSKHVTLHLFDSFEGLPEDWIGDFKKGFFKLDEKDIPTFNSNNVTIHKGLFSNTVPIFEKEYLSPLAFVHIDSDLYSSAREVLFNINSKIIPETIILFDEYFGYAGCEKHESKAFAEWQENFNREVEPLCKTDYMQMAFKVIN